MKSEPYIRKKGSKFIIEQKVDGKTIFIKTLRIREILEFYFGEEASQFYENIPQKKRTKASENSGRLDSIPESEEGLVEKFSQSKLDELEKKTPEPTEEELEASLFEIGVRKI